jgi:hypothetical protein
VCTVTLVPTRDGCRLVCNRDELRSRPAAMPPRLIRVDGLDAMLPVDPVSGGTWIAANAAGLAIALLNVTSRAADATAQPGTKRRSRGEIIPRLIGLPDVRAVARAAARIDCRPYGPFRLLAADRHEACDLIREGRSLEARFVDDAGPLMRTSSSLGDALVQAPRQAAFARRLATSGGLVVAQDLFHAEYWPDRPHLSVLMRRRDARTVSRTTVELSGARVTLKYVAQGEAGAKDAHEFDNRVARS